MIEKKLWQKEIKENNDKVTVDNNSIVYGIEYN